MKKNRMIKTFLRGLILTLFILNQACSDRQKTKTDTLVSVQLHADSQTLFYSGIIQPLHQRVVTNPAEGVIIDMPFQYGQAVKSGQLLFVISSTKFLTDYKTALMQYVKTKSEMNTMQTQLNEAKFLHKNQLISDDDFKMKQSGYYAARLALLQAKDTLENLLHQLNINDVNLYNLTIANIDKINQALHPQSNRDNLRIVSPVDGIVLAPNKSSEESKQTMQGDAVKQGDVLALIGDMQGITVQVKVNELIVNQLHAGQTVKITGIAFPDMLTGKITRVDKQGEIANGGLPTFNVDIAVYSLTHEQQKNIHVGMSAKIEMTLQEDSHLTVPLAAVNEKDGLAFVNLWDEKLKTARKISVQTGKTTLDSVVILAGLKEGDKIVLTH